MVYCSFHRLPYQHTFFLLLDQIEERLDRMGSLLRAADRNEVFLNRLKDLDALLRVASLNELLTEIVSIVIPHKFPNIVHALRKEETHKFILSLQLLNVFLKESGPGLVQSKSCDKSGYNLLLSLYRWSFVIALHYLQ